MTDQAFSSEHQQGMVLVIGLIFLLLMTIIGVTSIQTTTLDERMAANLRDRNIAFQAAESALRSAESWISDPTTKPIELLPVATQGANKVWTLDSPNDASPWWSNDAAWDNAISLSGLPGVTTQPKRIIEELRYVTDGSLVGGTQNDGSGSMYYRVTARGTGGTDSALVMLQSTYAKR